MSNITTTATTPVTMTSLELVDFINATRKAGESELRHDNFLAKVPKVLGEKAAPKFLGTAFYTVNNARREQKIYIFPKREALLMAMSYSYELQAKVLDRMTALEQQVAALLAAQQAQEQQRIAERQAARLECPALATAVSEQRALEGKEAKPHHFSNEYDLINRIVLGSTAAKYRERQCLSKVDSIRDSLTATQVTAIADLQRVNTSLVSIGMSYADRKEHLNKLYMRKYNEALCIETINSYA